MRVRAMVALALVAACGSNDGPVPPQPTPVEIVPGIHVLSGISPTLPYWDLQPLQEIVGDATVVALGESTHTSAGYYQAKSRLIRYMVEELGFRVVFMESSWIESLVATEHVRGGCTYTADVAVRSLNTVWRDPNVRELLTWLCQYNQAHPQDKVTFLGFDIQEPWKSAPAVDAFVKAVAPAEAARVQPLFQCLGVSKTNASEFFASAEFADHYAGRRNTTAHASCLAGLTDLESWIAANSASLTAASSARRVEEARLSLLALRAWEDQLWLPDPEWYEVRDRAMATMILRLRALEAPQKKAIVWAWNWHIAWEYQDVRGFDADRTRVLTRQGGRSMGGFLRESIGTSYRPIALIGYEVRMYGANQPPIPADELSIERRLHQFDEEYLLVDLRTPPSGNLIEPGVTYSVSQEWGDPYRNFAALLFLDYSAPMTFIF